MNVIGSRPDGWWRDRGAAQRRLIERLEGLERHDEAITVVFDGQPRAVAAPGGTVEVLFAARRGRNAADDRIVELVEQSDDPAAMTVVTSDRELQRRVRAYGASVRGAGSLLDELDAAEA